MYVLLISVYAIYVVAGIYFCWVSYRVGYRSEMNAAFAKERAMLLAYPTLGRDFARSMGMQGLAMILVGAAGTIVAAHDARSAVMFAGLLAAINTIRFNAINSLKKKFHALRRRENLECAEAIAQHPSNPHRPLARLLLGIGAWFAMAALAGGMLADAGIHHGASIFAVVCGLVSAVAIGWAVVLLRAKSPAHRSNPIASP
ncbi:MAG: hypothetical protein JO142_11655 [Burkholderiales bacterium]|nr:hypothetical protein [Burkholderiales bacterium]